MRDVAGGPTLTELIAAVRAEGRAVDLNGAVRRAGAESAVLETEEWIFRFPREHVDFDRELAVLAALGDRLPVRIPRVEWIGRFSRFCAYRKIIGGPLNSAHFADQSYWRTVIASMAEFLASMHQALSSTETSSIGIPDFYPLRARAAFALGDIPAQVRQNVSDLVVRALRVADRVDGAPAVPLHNDFTSDNTVFDDSGRLTGVWDFSGVSVGPPSFDFRYLSAPLLRDVAVEYENLTGIQVDREAAALAGRIAEVWALLRRGTEVELIRTIATWPPIPESAS